MSESSCSEGNGELNQSGIPATKAMFCDVSTD